MHMHIMYMNIYIYMYMNIYVDVYIKKHLYAVYIYIISI